MGGRISWTRRIIDEEVICMTDAQRSMFETVEERNLTLFGHGMRHDSLQRDVSEGMVKDTRGKRKMEAKTAMK